MNWLSEVVGVSCPSQTWLVEERHAAGFRRSLVAEKNRRMMNPSLDLRASRGDPPPAPLILARLPRLPPRTVSSRQSAWRTLCTYLAGIEMRLVDPPPRKSTSPGHVTTSKIAPAVEGAALEGGRAVYHKQFGFRPPGRGRRKRNQSCGTDSRDKGRLSPGGCVQYSADMVKSQKGGC